MPAKPVNLGAKYEPLIEANVAGAVIVPFDIFGRTWHATDSGSVVALMDLSSDETGGKTIEYLAQLVISAESEDFRKVLSTTRGLDNDVLIGLVNDITELVAAVPTEPPSASPATSRSRTTGGPSKAASSSTVRRAR